MCVLDGSISGRVMALPYSPSLRRAVLHFCGRGLFATHYHKLADAHADDPTTSIRHMACHVDRDAAGREQVLHCSCLLWLAQCREPCPAFLSESC